MDNSVRSGEDTGFQKGTYICIYLSLYISICVYIYRYIHTQSDIVRC